MKTLFSFALTATIMAAGSAFATDNKTPQTQQVQQTSNPTQVTGVTSQTSSKAEGTGVGVGVGVGKGGAGGDGGLAIAGGGDGQGGGGGSVGDTSAKTDIAPVVMYQDAPMTLPQAVVGDEVVVLSDIYKFGPIGYAGQKTRMTSVGALNWSHRALEATSNDGTPKGELQQAAVIAALCADENGYGERVAEQLNIACR